MRRHPTSSLPSSVFTHDSLNVEGAVDVEGLDVEPSVDSRGGGVVDAAGEAQGALSGVVADAQEEVEVVQLTGNCLLYTSDAADE